VTTIATIPTTIYPGVLLLVQADPRFGNALSDLDLALGLRLCAT
jgi:hypothetical protein